MTLFYEPVREIEPAQFSEDMILNDLIYVVSVDKYWWVSQQMFIKLGAVNELLAPMLDHLGIRKRPAVWLRMHPKRLTAPRAVSEPGGRLLVNGDLNIAWRPDAS